VDWGARQNPDGGWAYSQGCSWTEPTVLALLAQLASGDTEACERGFAFVRSLAAADGGWRPQSAVAESTWVTSMAALLPPERLGQDRYERAVRWLLGQTGQESSLMYRLRQRLSGNRDRLPDGWPWFPGAAAWVIPTSFGMLAFRRARRLTNDPALDRRIASGAEFLFARMCADGGWNHGSSHALGRDGDSYPETTGIALLALRGFPASPALARAVTAAKTHLRTCRTAEGIAWLRMGLAAHGEAVTASFEPAIRTNTDAALRILSGNRGFAV
jgi:hypothetical protein